MADKLEESLIRKGGVSAKPTEPRPQKEPQGQSPVSETKPAERPVQSQPAQDNSSNENQQ